MSSHLCVNCGKEVWLGAFFDSNFLCDECYCKAPDIIAQLRAELDKCVAWHEGDDSPHAQLEQTIVQLRAEIDQYKKFQIFHPRAIKLLEKEKNFLVVAVDEPYYMQVYDLIRKHECETGRWSDEDEITYMNALGWKQEIKTK